MPLKHHDSWTAHSWLLHERFFADHQNGTTVWADVFKPFYPWITFVEDHENAKQSARWNTADGKLGFHRNGGYKVHAITTREILNATRLKCFFSHRTTGKVVTHYTSGFHHDGIRLLNWFQGLD